MSRRHLEVKGDAIPPQVKVIGESFNTVLAYRDPMQPIVYEETQDRFRSGQAQ